MKIVVTGPECSGKTTLSVDLSNLYHTTLVAEYARPYLANKQGEYEQADLLEIAKGQLTIEKLVERRDKIICDTSLLVIYVWSMHKYGSVDPELVTMLEAHKVDLYLLPHWDIPYVAEPLRESEHEREELYYKYLRELQERHLPYMEVKGDRLTRVNLASQTINTFKKYST